MFLGIKCGGMKCLRHHEEREVYRATVDKTRDARFVHIVLHRIYIYIYIYI